ncbi:MAG TPA: UDP-N-acetylmuramate--L-alanine ligase [Candidatus Limnocylindrales bacterium]|nr:UDP-N-acetylmuramate--L-alanine ligase [Candidatus Limnocylindrales bacterium]
MYGRIRRIHLVGIGGSGMSGIAEVLLNLGYQVSGSDTKEGEPVARLRSLGARVFIGHRAEQVEGADVVVASTAIAESNPEIQASHQRSIPVIPRAEMLAELMRIKYSVAVAGAHGKTTTTSMVGEILSHGSLDPTVIVGGRLMAVGANARLGSGPFLVAEADESDGSFLLLTPTIAVVTNIDAEHLDYYRDLAHVQETFLDFVNRVPFYGTVILPHDDPNVTPLRSRVKRRLLTYGFTKGADFEGSELHVGPDGVRYRLKARGRDEGFFELKVSGTHNARNALAATVAGWELGIPIPKIRDALREFSGVSRRLEVRGEVRGALWVDDYGHHPTEIEAAVRALRDTYGRRIVAVFQPHRFTRTKALRDRFTTCFTGVSELVLLPIYPAGEAPIPGVSSEMLVEGIRANGTASVRMATDFGHAAKIAREILRQGDVFVTIGAGDVYRVGELARGGAG